MYLIEKDTTIPFDVDETLVSWKPENTEIQSDDIELDYYGEKVYISPNLENIRLLRSSIARGRNVIVWSGNGFAWCKVVLDYLVLSGHLINTDGIVVMSKPYGYVDDVDCANWMGNRIYIKPTHDKYGKK